MKKAVKKMLKNENIRLVRIPYTGKRLNAGMDWHKLNSPIKLMWKGFWNEFLQYLPASNFKNYLTRLFLRAKIGRDVVLGPRARLDPLFPELITIEDGATIGGDSLILAHEFSQNETILGRTIIKKNVMIGTKCLVRPGIIIGENAIVSSMSYVNKDVKPSYFVGGVPAKEIKKIYPKISYKSIGEFIKEKAAELKDKTFLIYSEDDSRVSYKEFHGIVNKTANLFLSLGAKKGDKISSVIHD